MKKMTAGALALTAFTLAGCGDTELSTEEAQAQLDATFAEIDALPKYTQDRFQEFRDPDGECAVAYKDDERGIKYEYNGLNSFNFQSVSQHEFPLPQMVRTDCDDLQRAYQKALTTLAVDDVRTLSGADQMSEYNETSMNEYRSSVTDYVRFGMLDIKTFGLK